MKSPEYTGEQKNTGPVTLTTYQILTWRADRESEFPHLEPFRGAILGTHRLRRGASLAGAGVPGHRRSPGPQAVGAHGHARCARTVARPDVFALIGPKRFDVPWKDLEQQAWIATATCVEIRVPMSAERRMEYALAPRRAQFRVAAENPAKLVHLRDILGHYPQGRVLVIGEIHRSGRSHRETDRSTAGHGQDRAGRPGANLTGFEVHALKTHGLGLTAYVQTPIGRTHSPE